MITFIEPRLQISFVVNCLSLPVSVGWSSKHFPSVSYSTLDWQALWLLAPMCFHNKVTLFQTFFCMQAANNAQLVKDLAVGIGNISVQSATWWSRRGYSYCEQNKITGVRCFQVFHPLLMGRQLVTFTRRSYLSLCLHSNGSLLCLLLVVRDKLNASEIPSHYVSGSSILLHMNIIASGTKDFLLPSGNNFCGIRASNIWKGNDSPL